MNIVSVQSLSKTHGVKPLLTNASFGIEDNDRIGVIGVNGAGKSTLLRMIAGMEPPDSGQITMRQNLRIEFLPQNPLFNETHTVLEDLFHSGRDVAQLVREYEAACSRIACNPHEDALHSHYDRIVQKMDAAGAWEYETRVRTILTKLGIKDLDAPVAQLSGGYRKRVALARALLSDADLLILDEPTNHLDADTVAWLETYLQRFNGAVLMVTHDRYFLDRVTQRIIELDRGGVALFDGNFSWYLERKAEAAEAAASHEQRRRAILRRELEWLKRGARARTTKAKARVERVHDLQSVKFTEEQRELKLEAHSRRLGKTIAEAHNISKSYGSANLISNFSYVMKRGERLGIVGPNGAGKSTLANILTERVPPDSGTVRIGETVRFGYFDQESAPLDPAERALDYVKREGGDMLRTTGGSPLSATLVMERFLFTPQMLYSTIGNLSGGERRRLFLVRVLMSNPNFLILDEPTNDLDIPTLQALEDFLDSYRGCLIVISHDRYFLDRTADSFLAFEGNGVLRLYPGGYETYCRLRAEMEEERGGATQREPGQRRSAALADSPSPAPRSRSAKLSFNEQRELTSLEARIPKLEEQLKRLENEMAASAADYVRLQALATEHDLAAHELETAFERWTELAERA